MIFFFHMHRKLACPLRKDEIAAIYGKANPYLLLPIP